MNTPNSITCRPGATYRINDGDGNAVARATRLVSGGWWGPAGWYDLKSGALIGFDEQSAIDWITLQSVRFMLSSGAILVRGIIT